MKLKQKCPTCGIEITSIQSEFEMFGKFTYVYQCGHMEMRNKLVLDIEPIKVDIFTGNVIPAAGGPRDEKINFEMKLSFDFLSYVEGNLAKLKPAKQVIPEVFWSKSEWPEYHCDECNETHTKRHAYKYQREGVEFVERAAVNALIADDMGLGKTLQSLLTLKRSEAHLLPALIIVKGATLFQWPHEISDWITKMPFDVMTIIDRSCIRPGFKYYVISMDLLSRKGVLELLLTLNLKCVVIDECQNFKDASSKRTVALIKLLQEGNIEHKIALSGTPIKNRADEYFVILNLLAPAYFTSYHHFCRQWLIIDEKGNYTKLNPYQERRWKEVTGKWIIRRETLDVQKDLPEMRINYRYVEIEDPLLKKSYNYQLQLFENFLTENGRAVNSTQLLGWLAKLRAITGQAKIPNAVEFIKEFFDNTENEKICVGIHHKNVRDILRTVFEQSGVDVLTLSGEDSNWDKRLIVKKFADEKYKLLIANMIAGGTGVDGLQVCSNFLCLERQWSGTDEDQFHKRFQRTGQKKKVSGTYFIAKNTIDEFFHEMVFVKRNNLNSVGIGQAVGDEQSIEFLREFSEFVVRHKI